MSRASSLSSSASVSLGVRARANRRFVASAVVASFVLKDRMHAASTSQGSSETWAASVTTGTSSPRANSRSTVSARSIGKAREGARLRLAVLRPMAALEHALRRREAAGGASLDRDGLLHGLREGLEDRLGLVVVVLAVGHLHVDVRLETPCEAVEELREEPDRHVPHALRGELHVVDELGPPGDVDGDDRERLLHGASERARARDPGARAQRQAEGLAEDDPRVLDRVVLIDLDVARDLDREVEQAVLREAVEEVVEERDRPLDVP